MQRGSRCSRKGHRLGSSHPGFIPWVLHNLWEKIPSPVQCAKALQETAQVSLRTACGPGRSLTGSVSVSGFRDFLGLRLLLTCNARGGGGGGGGHDPGQPRERGPLTTAASTDDFCVLQLLRAPQSKPMPPSLPPSPSKSFHTF
jgi:hypothetical protein